VILSYGDIVFDELPAGDLRADVDEMRMAARRAATLTNQLLLFSRRRPPTPQSVDLGDLVSDMENMLRCLAREDVEIAIDRGSAPIPRVRADRGGLEQVVMNLVVNARDAMPNGGRITIRVSTPSIGGRAHVRLEVIDTGIGFDEATKERLFEPFFTTKELGLGTGLGLSTVHAIVQQSGGTIETSSVVGAGSTFRVDFPACEAASAAKPTAASARLGGNETILLVEDEDQVRSVARGILTRRGYRVLEARSGPDALAISASHPDPIHLVVSDVVMPGMSGDELARRIAAQRAEVKVLLMSGYPDREGTGGLPFVDKPFTSDILAVKIREALEG
jgi:two-component system cell cycle sensor histidine kinase/response regulator CckA